METTSPHETTLRFLAAPTDVADLGGTAIGGGRVLEWIDKAAYACAVGWCGGYCVTAYVGNITFARPIHSGDLVEIRAHLIHTGRSSMHIDVTVSSADPQHLDYIFATSCTVIFVAVGSDGRPVTVRPWTPDTPAEIDRQAIAVAKTGLRAAIETAMADQTYTSAGTAPIATLRFLAAPTDVNWGGKAHGGTVMRWIDEAAFVCATNWTRQPAIATYSGGVRFYRPIQIGHLVEVQARLLHTGHSSMHISVHVRSGDLKTAEMQLTTHCLTIFVALDDQHHPTTIPQWGPHTDEDRRLDSHAQHLMELRAQLAPARPA